MNRFTYLTSLFLVILLISCKTEESKNTGVETKDLSSNAADISENQEEQNMALNIQPITHATMVLTHGDTDIYVDPTGGIEAFETYSTPEMVLITDIHGDHYDIETLKQLDLTKSTVIAPQAVVDKFPEDLDYGNLVIMDNGETKSIDGYKIETIPMYNLREEALKYHTKGRGNGYILNIDEERIYISGDTEDIPEMRNLENIDIAFVCMNLPYTMPVESAVSAVLEFKPNKVYPYHYRGTDGLSDVEKFKTLVNQGDESIEVIQLDWYD